VSEAATQRQGKLSEIKNTAKSVISQFKDLTLKIAWAWLQSIAASTWMKAVTSNKTIINIKSHQEC
jgi:N-acetylmuramic acid 6-phosphate (MurNAc-6-P) etherase